ncbi:hypothetical protein H1Z61_11915 [Bacillus aquiflavi]|uniref:Uncharacterized protein n=1 Tax=Bacillus aquiflavi TaxID=2672567 RepID=A0A6B3W278_9BACI|nr:hypothetical protein [Bacillus aquiflavi]MBA4537817.1 hypothetical protein [Bacillus aquiflavi]NEY82073.1 hypothetical protein [Bacillus aquiflavi]
MISLIVACFIGLLLITFCKLDKFSLVGIIGMLLLTFSNLVWDNEFLTGAIGVIVILLLLILKPLREKKKY